MKFLIAGFGSIGRRHFQNLKKLGQEDILLLRSGRSKLPTEELEGFTVQSELQAALAHKPDAVIIANPTSKHLDVAIPAAEAGLHILMEKPISHSMERMEELQDAAAKSGSQILVGFQYRYHPALIQMKAVIDSGEVGKPLQARVHWGEYLPDWHPWEDYRKSYSARNDLGGGVALTLSHPFDYLHWLMGKVENVSGMTANNGVLGIEVDEQAQANLRFAGGSLANVQLDYLQKPATHCLEIQCEAGNLICDFVTGYFKLFRNDSGKLEEFPPAPEFERNTLFLDQMRHFIDITGGKSEASCTLSDGIHALQIALAVHESSASGKQIEL
jgi:predicted dehydrogenase